jgi:hypothetical protein
MDARPDDVIEHGVTEHGRPLESPSPEGTGVGVVWRLVR